LIRRQIEQMKSAVLDENNRVFRGGSRADALPVEVCQLFRLFRFAVNREKVKNSGAV